MGCPWPFPALYRTLIASLNEQGLIPLALLKPVQLGPHCIENPLDIFKLVQLGPQYTGILTIPLKMFKLVHCPAHTVGKWAVGIRLECLLV